MAQSDLYTVGEAAAMLGVSAHTIRAWERRHGILNPTRTASRHRRYRPEDIDLLRDIKRAVALEGLSVRLAFETVTGRQQRAGAQAAGTRQKPVQIDPLEGDHEMWRAVADALPELILIVDVEGKIVQANVAMAKAYGVVRQQLAGRAFTELVEPSDRAKAELLFRPQPRSVNGWELNLATRDGPRLFRIQSRALSHDGETSLALVASEMFTEDDARRIAELHEQAMALAKDASTATTVFQKLLDELPFGVAVTTIGPEPRVVYANQRLADTLNNSLPNLTSRPLTELLPRRMVERSFLAATADGKMKSLKGVVPGDAATHRVLDVVFQPLFSTAKKLASMLVVIEDPAGPSTETDELSRLLSDDRFVHAKTVRELALAAMEHLRQLAPERELVIAIANPDKPDGDLVLVSSKDTEIEQHELVEALGDVIHRAAEAGSKAQTKITVGGSPVLLSALPLTPRRKMGAIAWRRPADAPLTGERRDAAKAVVDRVAIAAELLHVKAEAARRASKLKAIVEIAAVVREPGDQASLGVRFLKRVCEIVEADGAAMGRAEGGDFVVEAAYAPSGAHAKPGDRFPLRGLFVSQSLAAGEPTEGKDFVSPGLPSALKASLSRMRTAVSVPLVVDGRVEHVITLLRTAERPFDEGDVMIAQAVSSVALVALNVGTGVGSPAATPARRPSRSRSGQR